MRRRSVLTGALILIAVALVPAALAAADPAAVISNLGNRALEVLGKNATPAQRVARFQELFREDFDVPGIARFVLGRYWKTATPEQQAELRAQLQQIENEIAQQQTILDQKKQEGKLGFHRDLRARGISKAVGSVVV